MLALRIAVVLAAFAVHSACVDPDRVLRLLRPLARHSALTATLIARLVPLAAADHARLSEAAALRGPAAAPVGRAAIVRRLVAGSLDRAVDVAAALELRGYARGAPGRAVQLRRSRHSWRFAAAGAAIVAARPGRAARRGGRLRRLSDDRSRRPARRRLGLAACLPALRCAAGSRRPAGVAMADPLVSMRELLLPLRRRRARCPRARSTSRSPRASSSSRPGARDRASRRLLRAVLRPDPALPRRRGLPARSRSAAWTSAITGPPSSAALVGLVGQDPETQVVSATVRGELELPLELRGETARGPRPGGRGGDAGARDRRTCSIARPTPSRAASCSGSRSRRPWSCARALILLDEPTSQLDPVAGDELIGLLRRLNEEWGMGVVLAEHRLERCLAAADRVVALRRAVGVAFDGPPQAFGDWALERRPVARHRRRAALLDSPGCGRCRWRPRRRGGPCASRASDPGPGLDVEHSAPALEPRRRAAGAATRPQPALRARDLWVELDTGSVGARRAARPRARRSSRGRWSR